MLRLFAALLCSAGIGIQAKALQYQSSGLWVSPKGSDSNPGTANKPLRSPLKAQMLARELIAAGLQSNLTITIESGQYFLNDTLRFGQEDSGNGDYAVRWVGSHAGKPWCSVPASAAATPNSIQNKRNPTRGKSVPLAVGPLADEQATQWAAQCDAWDSSQASILSVGVPVINWQPPSAGKRAWTGHLPTGSPAFKTFPSDMTDMNGTVRTRARTPDLGSFYVWNDTLCHNVRSGPCENEARYGFVYSPGDIPDSFEQPLQTRVVAYHGWTDSAHAVRAVFPENRTLLLVNPSDRPIGYWSNHDSEGGGRYFYESLESLDSAGEWYFDWENNVPMYIPGAGEGDPNEMGFVLSRLTDVVVLENAHHIDFDGLSFRHAAWACDYEGGQVCDAQSTSWQSYAAVNIGLGSHTINVLNSEVAASGGPGIWASANVSLVNIEGCSVHDLGAGGLRIGFDNTFGSAPDSGGEWSYASPQPSDAMRKFRTEAPRVGAKYCHPPTSDDGAETGVSLPAHIQNQADMGLQAGMGVPPVSFYGSESTQSLVPMESESESESIGRRQGQVSGGNYISATEVAVRGNVISRGGLSSASGTGITAQWAMQSQFEHNEVRFFAYAGISLGWCWNYASPSGSGDNMVSGNYIHDLGTGTYRQLGDAMAAIYTLGVQQGTVIMGNIGHDVYASYSGGYGLSQDQGSSNIIFANNTFSRINAAPQTQHYGQNNSYENNMFLYGMYDAATFENTPGLRSVCPQNQPSNFRFERNIVAFSNSTDNETFHGAYNFHAKYGSDVAEHKFDFTSNCYWNFAEEKAAFEQKSIWGGCSKGYCLGSDSGESRHLTFEQWQGGCGTSGGSSPTNCTGPKQDAGSVVADPLFVGSPEQLQFELAAGSPCFGAGYQAIDLSRVGVAGA